MMANRTASTGQGAGHARVEQPGFDFAVFGHTLVEAADQGDRQELLLYGRLDLASARMLDAELLAPMTHPGSEITVDLAGLSQLDRLAVRVLLRRQRLAHVEGFRLLIRLAAGQAAHVV